MRIPVEHPWLSEVHGTTRSGPWLSLVRTMQMMPRRDSG